MPRFILAVLVAATLPCLAAKADTCSTFANVEADVLDWQDGSTVKQVDADETPRFVAALKAEEGFAHLGAVTAAIVHHPHKPNVIFVTFSGDGCATMTWYIRRQLFFDLLSDKGI